MYSFFSAALTELQTSFCLLVVHTSIYHSNKRSGNQGHHPFGSLEMPRFSSPNLLEAEAKEKKKSWNLDHGLAIRRGHLRMVHP
jgi:hypothetical protein